jgi:MoaA/NifB/PqqE/SkfB family radical SAM enzyme
MKPLVVIPQYFGSLVFDRRTSRYAPFDRDATALLETCLVESAWDRPEVDFVECFERAGYFGADGRLAGVRLDAAPPTTHLLGPLAVHVEVIAACNLTCTHCFAGELPRKTSLTTPELDRVFGELAALGSFRIGLTGGEPLLRKDLLDVIDAALAHGLHPCLTTNGLLLDEHVARELGKRELVWLNVSLEGAVAATNDRVRGAGVFDAVVGKLRALGKHMRFTLAFTITRDSASEIAACAELARELGAHTAVFRPLYPVGVARPEMMPSFAEYTNALAQLTGSTNTIDPLGFSPQQRVETQAVTYRGPGCGAANLVASISATGDVNPCSFLGTGFDSGNVRDRAFAEIWNAGQAFLALRESRGEFRGGCRARALTAHGSAYARDPWHDEWLRGTATGELPCAASPGSAGTRSTAERCAVSIEPLTNLHARVHLPVLP